MNPVIPHRLPATSFAVLARGDGSADITREFWETEESRRLLLVSTLVNEITESPGVLGPLAPVGDALAVLAEAQRVAPQAVRDLLMNPVSAAGAPMPSAGSGAAPAVLRRCSSISAWCTRSRSPPPRAPV